MKWFFRNWPLPPSTLYAALVVLAIAVAITHWVVALVTPQSAEERNHLIDAVRAVLFITFALYGFARPYRPHPAVQPAYARWLVSSPWTAAKPLPLGPLHLVWQDFLLLASGFAFTRFYLGDSGCIPVIVFFLAYTLASLLILANLRPHPLILLPILGLPAIILTASLPHPEECSLVLAALLYPITAWLHRDSLRRFPWKLFDPPVTNPDWLFSRLSPAIVLPKKSSLPLALAITLVLAWTAFCIASIGTYLEPRLLLNDVGLFLFCLPPFVALLRYMTYGASFAPPISFFGRLATGHLLLPGYDQIFLAPLLILLIGGAAPLLLLLNVPFPLTLAATIIASFLPALTLGPSLTTWKLTGHHRISSRPQPSTRRRRQSYDISIARN